MQVPPGLLKKCNEQSYGVSNMLYCQSVASINVWERRKFINRAPQLAPVLHSHHCSLSETFKCLHISFISPGTWICLLYFLLSWKCVWKRKQGLDVACLYHILFSCVPVQSLCRQDNPILHFLAEAGTVPCSPPHLVTGLSPGKLMSLQSGRWQCVLGLASHAAVGWCHCVQLRCGDLRQPFDVGFSTPTLSFTLRS